MKIQSENFSLEQIAESGQCFRMNKIDENKYSLIAFGEYVELVQVDEQTIELKNATDNNTSHWESYFDLAYDYNKIVAMLVKGEDDFLRKAARFGRGLRILRQETFEILISFIISQNKNIPAIKSSVEKLCRFYGEEKPLPKGATFASPTYYAFPQPERLALAGKDALRKLGLGYRDEYVHLAALAVAEGSLNLDSMKDMEEDLLMQGLMSLKGVGKKVASCVALFGFHRMGIAPVDVWISRIDKEIYQGQFNWDKYGDVAGLVQQYMFYYIRNCEKL